MDVCGENVSTRFAREHSSVCSQQRPKDCHRPSLMLHRDERRTGRSVERKDSPVLQQERLRRDVRASAHTPTGSIKVTYAVGESPIILSVWYDKSGSRICFGNAVRAQTRRELHWPGRLVWTGIHGRPSCLGGENLMTLEHAV